MKDKYVLTAESVTEGHPDKLCDTIADAVVDACLEHDPTAHVACEVMATAGKIIAAGEITLPLSAAPCGKPDMATAIMRWR
jgi:S-adenosylmethionine synthetase